MKRRSGSSRPKPKDGATTSTRPFLSRQGTEDIIRYGRVPQADRLPGRVPAHRLHERSRKSGEGLVAETQASNTDASSLGFRRSCSCVSLHRPSAADLQEYTVWNAAVPKIGTELERDFRKTPARRTVPFASVDPTASPGPAAASLNCPITALSTTRNLSSR
jgi:hypothetical protein